MDGNARVPEPLMVAKERVYPDIVESQAHLHPF